MASTSSCSDGTRSLGRRSPLTASVFALLLLSFAGIPLTSGFIGKLTVFTNPEPGATLFVDGVRKGKTPVTIDITRGKHQLRVELEGLDE